MRETETKIEFFIVKHTDWIIYVFIENIVDGFISIRRFRSGYTIEHNHKIVWKNLFSENIAKATRERESAEKTTHARAFTYYIHPKNILCAFVNFNAYVRRIIRKSLFCWTNHSCYGTFFHASSRACLFFLSVFLFGTSGNFMKINHFINAKINRKKLKEIVLYTFEYY